MMELLTDSVLCPRVNECYHILAVNLNIDVEPRDAAKGFRVEFQGSFKVSRNVFLLDRVFNAPLSFNIEGIICKGRLLRRGMCD